MDKDYLENLKFEAYHAFRGIDSLFAYLVVFIALIVGFLHIIFNDTSIFLYFPLPVLFTYIMNILLFILVIYIWRNTMAFDIEKLEAEFSLIKETSVFLIQMMVVYFMPITCVTFGFAFMNYDAVYNNHQLFQLIQFTLVLMLINILFLMPVNRNIFKWQNIVLALLFLGLYIYYYFSNNDFLHKMDEMGNFEVFTLYPKVVFLSFVISLRIGFNFFSMLEEFGYWDKKEREKYLEKQNKER
ncbi:hypothetical protein [Macrococcus armenti]|uniref:hypothetical protein n=1 Tax=Macrococcus armenti TaxID=2875764 RepID=UPI001CCC9CEF|nr:hypothetical protein [Macrococcus armenti]UBH08092.1 hypothetical protein LAU41_08685 [Macrococcus armenti]UBH10321.1 hypothetical protein LAU38_08595 [Macrococcus armenti]